MMVVCAATRAAILGGGVMRIAAAHHQIPIPRDSPVHCAR
jgi:hypothetical protein